MERDVTAARAVSSCCVISPSIMPAIEKGDKILVTGASGFIGAQTAKAFIDHGYSVVGTGEFQVSYPLIRLTRDCSTHPLKGGVSQEGPGPQVQLRHCRRYRKGAHCQCALRGEILKASQTSWMRSTKPSKGSMVLLTLHPPLRSMPPIHKNSLDPQLLGLSASLEVCSNTRELILNIVLGAKTYFSLADPLSNVL